AAARGAGGGCEAEVGVRRPAPAGFSRSLRIPGSCLCCSPGGAGACCGTGFCRSALTFWDFLRLGSRWTLPLCWVCP
ncbi:hypothetical protein N305_11308, partial [Manacus vitellinus]